MERRKEHRNYSDLDNKKECIILLHGLFRSSLSMSLLAFKLKLKGYRVINLDYPSTKFDVNELAEIVTKKINEQNLQNAKKIHFVTHSLGGIIVRLYLKKSKIDKLGRVVMIAPPNKGSELVDYLKNNFFFKLMNGTAGQRLGTDNESIPNILGPVDFDLGIIAGNKSFNPFFSYCISGENDGKVSVERTKVEGMKDFIVLPNSHTFIMNSPTVFKYILKFIKNGRF
ncbi:MAG: alpha/beta fold hydrolase [Desulfobacterales bacterium]|nr:alpha/beta fold hydrolase [Desulfobacterales bacterium]